MDQIVPEKSGTHMKGLFPMIEHHFPDRVEQHKNQMKQVDEEVTVVCPDCLVPAQRVVTQLYSVIYFHRGGVLETEHGSERYPGKVCSVPVQDLPDPIDNPDHYLGFEHHTWNR